MTFAHAAVTTCHIMADSINSPLNEQNNQLIDSPTSTEPTEDVEMKDLSISDPDVVAREKWGSKFDFMLSCVGYAVGIGNVWRFPYLCYSNGGATFLIPYFLMLAINGIPLFYMELAIGQYLSLGTVGAWTAICPMARGVGFAMIMLSFLVAIYYNIIIAWCILFLVNSLRADVPWKTCDNAWNSLVCRTMRQSSNETLSCTALGLAQNCTPEWKSPAEEFFNNKILRISEGVEHLGSIGWEVTLSLFFAWVLVYFCLVKGVKSSGKVVYFTAVFPFIVLIILFFRGVTLDGASKGILFYTYPDFHKLKNPEVWVRAATQIFYSLGVGFGSLITFGSYNSFHNNVGTDALIVCLINCGTSFFAGFVIFSVMGFMAYTLGTSVDKVVDSGPGLAFAAYPEAISQMPVSTLWAILFFFMLITLGLDTQFGMVECVITGLSDEYPKYIRKYKWLLLTFMCAVMFLLALPMCTEGGMYVFNLMDYQSGGVSLLVVGFCEAIVVGWILGTDVLGDMVEAMTGTRPKKFFILCWKYISPIFTLGLIVAQLAMWKGVSYNNKPYPDWAEFIGWLLAFASMTLIPVFAVIQFYYAKGATFTEKIRNGLKHDSNVFKMVEIRNGQRQPLNSNV